MLLKSQIVSVPLWIYLATTPLSKHGRKQYDMNKFRNEIADSKLDLDSGLSLIYETLFKILCDPNRL